jgi:C_GCAxxG_C_C family probable redox protein
MQQRKARKNQQRELLTTLIRERSENLFNTGQLMCSEAVLSVLNQSLNGGLPPEMAIRLASGLPEGIGGSGCTCGALSGGVMALGLFLGRDTPGLLNGRSIRSISKGFHDRFKDRFGATCCRILLRHVKRESTEHFNLCATHTGWAASMAAQFILEKRQELISQADWPYLKKTDSVIRARWNRISGTFLGNSIFKDYPDRGGHDFF